jgi:pimeloyl-ACP methyl ester carboxylesterase
VQIATTFFESATDALAAVALLRLRPEVDPTRIGVWGPSEGGWVAPIAAAQSPDIAFVILKSGIAVTPEEQMEYAWRNSLLANNAPESTIVAIEHARKLVWTYARTGDGEAEARAALDLAKKLPGYPSDPESVGLVAQVPPFSVLNDPSLADKMFFVRTRSRFEPRPFLERVRVPTLAVLGRDDTDTPVDRTASVLRDAFRRSGNVDLAVVILPGDDHYLEHATASGKREMDPEYYRVMRDWLARHRFL